MHVFPIYVHVNTKYVLAQSSYGYLENVRKENQIKITYI